ncbi:hypothetical protein RvY_05856-1 [Ramazzottius varieornatus]|uniref:Uncharacterized protein n=1 Tax=Ramazzottius varieornatus TaxID=947166 RepID=A0A1D1V337_RAMVA|nr:hypothetical protein RvY_05856-1 [Ramazzottius varieornatus]
MYSATLGFIDCIRYLGGRGASKDHQDRKGRSAAHLAASKGQTESIMEIEELGGDIWLMNYRGDLPLHEAAQAGYIGVVECMLSKRPDYINAVNHNGRSCLHLAAMQKDFALCQFLVESKANVNLVMQNSKMQYFTALDLAIAKNNVEMIKYLRSHLAIESSQLTNKAALFIQQSFSKRFGEGTRLSSTASDPNGILEEAFETGLRSSPSFQSPLNFARRSSLPPSKAAGDASENSEPGETDGSTYPHLPREVTSSLTEFDHLVTMERHSDYDAIMEASVLGRRNSGSPQNITPIFQIPLHDSEEEKVTATEDRHDAQVPPLKPQNSSTSIAQHEVSGSSRSGATVDGSSRKRSVPKLEIEIVDTNHNAHMNEKTNAAQSARSEGPLTPVFEMGGLAPEPDVPSRSVSRTSLVKYESDSGSDDDMKHPDHRSNFMRKLFSQQNSFLTPKTPEHNKKLTMSRSYNSLHRDDMDLKAPGGDTGWQSARYQKSMSTEDSMHGLDASDFIAGFQHPALLSLFIQDNVVDHPASDSRVDDEEQTGVQPQSVPNERPPSRKHSTSSIPSAKVSPHDKVAIAVQTSARTPRQFKMNGTHDAGVFARRSNTSDSEAQTSARETFGSSWASDSSSIMSSTPRSRYLSVSTDDAHSFPLSGKGASDLDQTSPPATEPLEPKQAPIPQHRKSLETGGKILQRRASRLRWDDSNLDELHAAGHKPTFLDITSDHVSFREPETITDVVGGQVRTSPVIREAPDEDSDVAPEEHSTTQSLYSRFRPPTPRVLSLKDVRHTIEVPARSRTKGPRRPVLQTGRRDRLRPDKTESEKPTTTSNFRARRTRRLLEEKEQPIIRTLPQMPMKFVSSFNNTVHDIAPHTVIIKYLDQMEQMQKKDTKYNQSVVLAKVIPKYLKEMETIGKPDKLVNREDVTGKTKTFKDWQQYLLRKLNNLSPMNASPLTDISEARSSTTLRSRTESGGSSDTLPRIKHAASAIDSEGSSSNKQITNGAGSRSEKSSVGSNGHHIPQTSPPNGLSAAIAGETTTRFPIVSPLIHPFPWR